MNENESIRIGSKIKIPCSSLCKNKHEAEVIGFVVGGTPIKVRIQYTKPPHVNYKHPYTELRKDLNNDNVELIQY